VVVAPDFGAVRLAAYIATALSRPMAVVHKMRTSHGRLTADQITGDVLDMNPIIVDDMIASGGTIVTAVEQLLRAGSQACFVVAATHAVFAPGCAVRLAALPIQRLLLTDTLYPPDFDFGIQVETVSALIADAMTRLHFAYPMRELVGRRP
jgi:ribose-phosphate pyrophosphokinase